MKLMKLAIIFLTVILTFISCETTQKRNMHDRELRVELGKYSDVLDIANSRIYLEGSSYNSRVYLSLHLKPNNNNRETIIVIRDDLIAYFENNSWEVRGREGYYHYRDITIEFIVEEDVETITFYTLHRNAIFWREKWHDGILEELHIGRNIEELDTLLSKYSGNLDIEQSRSYNPRIGFIRVYLIVPGSLNRETQTTIGTMGDDLIDFFENNWQELVEKYGRLDNLYVYISFYTVRVKNGEPEIIYSINDRVIYREEQRQWERRWR